MSPTAAVLDRYHPLVDDAAAFQDALMRPLPRFVWTNGLRISPDALAKLLTEDGYRAEPLPWQTGAFRIPVEPRALGGHWAYQAGLFHIQEASSMIPVQVLAPEPGMRVLDLCAAPGNKTAQAAVAMGNRGTVVANDLRYHRMPSVRMHIDRLGLINVSTTCQDGGSYPRRAGLFDAVLVDAPCSCEGTSRKRPDIFDRPVPGRTRLLVRQRALLQRAVRLCRPGGRIVYSTCTYDPEENEAVVCDVMQSMPDQVAILPISLPGLSGSPGIVQWQGRRFHPDLCRTLRIWPHQNDTGGFFVALLKRTGNLSAEPEPSPALSDFDTGGPPFPPQPERMLSILSERYGILPEAFLDLRLLLRNRRQLFVACADHRPPAGTNPAAGLPLLHLEMKTPKLTTAGAAFLAPFVRRGVIEVDADQRRRYLARSPFVRRPDQPGPDAGPGHVLIRHRGFVLGVGSLQPDGRTVSSLYPKRFAVLTDSG